MTSTSHHSTSHHKPTSDQSENGLAIASLVLGITSLVGMGPITGIPAIITGYMSLKNPHRKEMGIAGIIMGGISTGLALIAILLFALLFIFILAAASTADTNEVPLQQESTSTSEMRTQQT